MLNSVRRLISYPNPDRSDRPDIPAHILNVVNAVEQDMIFAQGANSVRLARPHLQGTFFYETDTAQSYYDDGATWQPVSGAVPNTTTVPGSPTDGQRFLYVSSVTAPTWVWNLVYETSITDAYKWMLIGGSPLVSESTSAFSVTTTAVDGVTITLPRLGIYDIGAIVNGGASYGHSELDVWLDGISVLPSIMSGMDASYPANITKRITYSTGAGVLKLRLKSNFGGYNYIGSFQRISAIPVRIA